MTSETINVLLIEDNSDYGELVEQWLSLKPSPSHFRLRWADSLTQGLNCLSNGGTDVILLDLSLPESEGPATFTAIKERAQGVPVIILTAADSEALAIRLIQDGAEDYLVKSRCTQDQLVRAIRYAVLRGRSRRSPAERNGRIIGVLGAKGGVGATTLTCNIAHEIGRLTNERVLIADLDLHSGMVPFLMGVEPKYSVLEAISSTDFDNDRWQSIVAQKTPNLHILASPSSTGLPEMDAVPVAGLLRCVASSYGWMFLDLGTLNPFSRTLLSITDEALIVSTPAIPELFAAKRMVNELVQTGLECKSVSLVVNRADDFAAVSTRELMKMFGFEIRATLPKSSQELHEACVERRLPAGGGKFRTEVAKLARKLAGLPEATQKRGLSRLLALGDRLPKTAEADQIG